MFGLKGFSMVILPMIGVGFLANSLYKDFTEVKTIDSDKLKKLAILEFKNNTVKRKVDTSIVWSKIKAKDDLFLRDSVLTLDNSEAVIKFDSGAEIELNPKSLIVLEMVKDSLSVNFVKGNIYTKSTDKTLKIKVKDKEIKLQNAQVALTTDKISVLSGKVTSEGKVIEVVKNPFTIIKPELNEKILMDRKLSRVPIIWRKKKVRGPVTVDISKDYDLKKVYKSVTAKKLNNVVTRLPEGIYFFRLRAKHRGKKVYSNIQKFSLVFEMPTKLVYPRRNEVIRYKKKIPMVKFKWLAADMQDIFEVEVSRDRRFKKSQTSKKFKNNSALIKLPKGKYFARVRSYNKYRDKPLLSAITPFKIDEYAVLTAPMLRYPPNEHAFITRFQKSKGVRLTWNEVQGATGYIVRIAKDKEFKEVITDQKVTTNGYNLPELKGGNFYWKVQAIDQVGEEAKESKPWTYLIMDHDAVKLLEPKMNSGFVAKRVDKEKISFSWQDEQSPAKYFRLFIADNKAFTQNAKKFRTEKKKLNVRMPKAGKFFWSIKAFDETNKLVNTSNIRVFNVEDYPYLDPPKLTLPQKLQEFEYFSDIDLTFNWDKQEGAKEYIFKLYEGEKVLQEQKVTENTYKTKLPVIGNYSWEVVAIDNNNEQSKKTNKRNFRIIKEKRIVVPENHQFTIE